MEVRNIAIIAHGKTSLVDRMNYVANQVRCPENLGKQILVNNGSLVSLKTCQANVYSMNKLPDRGRPFVEPGGEIYYEQVVGELTREGDPGVNICKTKKLTNVRAAESET